MREQEERAAGFPRWTARVWFGVLSYEAAQLLALAAVLLDLVTVTPTLPDFQQHVRAVAAASASLLCLLLAWKRLPRFRPVIPLMVIAADLFVLWDAGGRWLAT